VTMVLLLMLAQNLESEGPPPQPDPEPPPAADLPEGKVPADADAPPPLMAPKMESPPVSPKPAPVHAEPGWARSGGFLGVGLAVVPLGLSLGAVVALWTQTNTTAQDWLTVSVGLTALLAALVPSFASGSAVVPDEAAHKPRLLRIIGWVMVIYGAASMIGGVAIGKAVAFAIQELKVTVPQEYSPVGKVIGTVTTLFDGLLCTVGIILLSMGSVMAGDRALSVVPTAALVPLPGGGVAMAGGLSGRW